MWSQDAWGDWYLFSTVQPSRARAVPSPQGAVKENLGCFSTVELSHATDVTRNERQLLLIICY